MAPNRSDESFAGWWLGGFAGAGATVAGTLVAVFADLGFVDTAGIAALGAIVGVIVGVRLAVALVLLADELGWNEETPTSRLGRLYVRLDQLVDSFT
jgi:hypothetical protein